MEKQKKELTMLRYINSNDMKITPRTMAPCLLRTVHKYSQGLVVTGGGERNAIEGIVVGIVGMEGIVGKVVGSGGNVRFGIEGMVGMLGSGGSVALGKDGWVVDKDGSVGGSVGCGIGRVGSEGKGGNLGFGRVGITSVVGTEGGAVSKRRRAARLTSMLENESRTKRDNTRRKNVHHDTF
ncbi:hypothetical protein PVL29_003687 [Vitis rotundifolia]|uniref:Uncharacterized protein n=1 Tax=Vitis rotundifolia TaxID=103349 RepID=A0AA39AG99_VITRO|nr:hypothetical protein PVL29_003687 [Vitis rotundifolia]